MSQMTPMMVAGRVDNMKADVKDILKLMDKADDVEQMVINVDAKYKDRYKLVNDRINELLERIVIIEKELRA